MSRLPRTALVNTTPEQRTQEEWTVRDEMAALQIEVSSVQASGRQLKKPITIPRPKHIKRAGGRQQYQHAESGATQTGTDPYKRGVALLAATTRGAVRRR